MSSEATAPDVHYSTVMDEKEQSLARIYAEALLSATSKEHGGQVDWILDEYDEFLQDVIISQPDFAAVLKSPFVPTEKKDEILATILEGKTSSTLTRFLRVLNRYERLQLLESVAREARELWEKRSGRIRVLATSAQPLDEDQVNRLKETVTSLFGGTPIVSFQVDPSLIGGLVVRSGDIVYDLSVKNQLQRLHARLLEQKNYEIQNRRDRFSH